MLLAGTESYLISISENVIRRTVPSQVLVSTLLPRLSLTRALKNILIRCIPIFLFFQPVEGFAGSLEPLVKLVRSVDKTLSRPAQLAAPAGRMYHEWTKKQIPKDEKSSNIKKDGEGFVLRNL